MLRAGIVGAGLIAQKKHIPAFLSHRRTVRLAAICDMNQQAAQSAVKDIPDVHVYSNLSEMLGTEKLDLVDICTPPQTHAALAVQAINAGTHVLIEKPMAPTLEDCDLILEASATK